MTHARPLVTPMLGRSVDEEHRASTTLELFFDLVFVVAIAEAASGLHHAIADDHVITGLINYGMVFFTIWWAWMNFTWFATAFDTDDVVYRLAVFVEITGALILAAGVPSAFESLDFTVVAIGYVVMRVPLTGLWLRAAYGNKDNYVSGVRMAGGIGVLQVAWVILLFLPDAFLFPGFFILALGEMLVPAWSSAGGGVRWHPEHIAERYGLMTIIVLGESILAASLAVKATIATGELSLDLLPTLGGGLLIVYSMWWIYFDRPAHDLLTTTGRAFQWGYGHYFIYSACAAVGAGIAIAVDQATNHAAIGAFGAGMSVAAPAAVFLLAHWILHTKDEDPPIGRAIGPVASALILMTPFLGNAVLLTGMILASLVALSILHGHHVHSTLDSSYH